MSRRKQHSGWLLKKLGKRAKNKPARAFKSKVSKHHTFKSARVILMMELDQKRAQSLRKHLKQNQRNALYDSIAELFRSLR